MSKIFSDVKTTSFLAEGTELDGVLEVRGGLRIDGRIKGEIRSESVVYVGEQADIRANISAEGVVANGKIRGNIRSARQVVLNLPGSIIGSVETRELILEKGVYFDGECSIIQETD